MHDRTPAIRLSAAEIALLGCFLFGRRWQTALARALGVHPSLVHRWASGKRPVSTRCTLGVLDLVSNRHARRSAAMRDHFCAMTHCLSAPVRARLSIAAEPDEQGDDRAPLV